MCKQTVLGQRLHKYCKKSDLLRLITISTSFHFNHSTKSMDSSLFTIANGFFREFYGRNSDFCTFFTFCFRSNFFLCTKNVFRCFLSRSCFEIIDFIKFLTKIVFLLKFLDKFHHTDRLYVNQSLFYLIFDYSHYSNTSSAFILSF